MTSNAHVFEGRPLTPHGEMTLCENDGVSYTVRFTPRGYAFDVLNHGPDWLKICPAGGDSAETHWRRMPDVVIVERL